MNSNQNLTLDQAKQKYDTIREIFDIYIEDELYKVYFIEGYNHNCGTDSYWLDYKGELIPYGEWGVHRICWEIKYKQSNYIKYKWNYQRIDNLGTCEMWANGKLVYTFISRDLGLALSRAQYLTNVLPEHPFDFINQEEEQNRKIWYYGLPAKIKVYSPGRIHIIPDYSYIEKDKWHEELKNKKKKYYSANETQVDYHEEESDSELITIPHGDVLYDSMIDWFRP